MKRIVKILNRTVVLVLIAALMVLSLSGCSQKKDAVSNPAAEKPAPQEVKQITLGTYTPTGGYMLLGSGIAKVVNEKVKGVNMTPVPSPKGSVENVETVGSKEREFGLASSNVVVDGATPREPFKEKQEIMGWFNAHYGVTWSIATESSGIKSFKDFEGKKIAIGAPGSNDEYLGEKVFLPAAGVDVSKVKLERVTMSEAVNLMKDGHIDGFIFTGAPKLGTIVELASARKVRFVPMEDSAIDATIAKYKEFVVKEVKEGDIPQLLMDKPSYKAVAMNHIAIVSPSVDEQLVYEMTKAVFENLEEIHAIKEEFSVITLEDAIKGMPVEVHPGALKYFKEKGIAK